MSALLCAASLAALIRTRVATSDQPRRTEIAVNEGRATRLTKSEATKMRYRTPTPSNGTRLLRLAVLATFAAIGAIVLVVVAQPRQPSDNDRLRQQQEASLYFPGSVLLREGGSGASMGAAAEIWRQLRTDASEETVLAFYRAELFARGWATGGGSTVALGTHESQVCSWHTGTYTMRVSFWKMDDFVKQYPADTGLTTVYEVRLMDESSPINHVACGHP